LTNALFSSTPFIHIFQGAEKQYKGKSSQLKSEQIIKISERERERERGKERKEKKQIEQIRRVSNGKWKGKNQG
jgi:hypothetical protein